MIHPQTPQEDLLAIETLVEYHHDRRDVQSERTARAWVLAMEIVASYRLKVMGALTQRDRLETFTDDRTA